MRITKLILTNFNSIYTAMGRKTIEIDFSEAKNRIILITGPNGSGKTSILSAIHPFANNGNLDIRDNLPLIRVGESGYKEIHIVSDEDEYVIKHYYIPSSDKHKVKSYIEKNGSELNANGNVTSFKELVKEELDITQDYLKLSRLGDNVTNFIDLKDTERKGFMGKLLSEVEVYLKMYKNATMELRSVKSIISHTVDKLKKLPITDIEGSKEELKILEERMGKGDTLVSKLEGELSVIDYRIKELGDYGNLEKEREKLQIRYNKIAKTKKERNKTDLEHDLESVEKEINDLDIQLVKLNTEFKLISETIDKKHNELKEANLQLDKITSMDSYKQTKKAANELRESIENRSAKLKLASYEPKVTSADVNALIVDIDRCIDIALTTYEFGIDIIKRAVEYTINNTNMEEYVKHHRALTKKGRLQKAAEIVYNEIGKIDTVDCKKKESCLAFKFYDRLEDLALEVEDEVVEDDDFVNGLSIAYQNISSILKIFKRHSNTIKNLPKNVRDSLSTSILFENMKKLAPLCDKSEVYAELTMIKEKELVDADIERLKDLNDKLNTLRSTDSNVNYLRKKIVTLKHEIEDTEDELEGMYNEIEDINEKIQKKKYEALAIKDFIEDYIEFDEISEKLRDITDKLEEYDDIRKKASTIKRELSNYMLALDDLKSRKNVLFYNISSYTTLTKELEDLKNDYDDLKLIQSALSSKDGIPLLYIQVYLKDIQDITNKLLSIVYNDLMIESFNITDESFTIPYSIKGTEIDDVAYASQGEKSFITLALSFALIYKSITKYNIMLLDEIDSTLDTSNREKFLQIVETQLDMINSEQIFIITHNNMFSMYPVSVIDTTNGTDFDNKLADYIPIL